MLQREGKTLGLVKAKDIKEHGLLGKRFSSEATRAGEMQLSEGAIPLVVLGLRLSTPTPPPSLGLLWRPLIIPSQGVVIFVAGLVTVLLACEPHQA